MRITGGKLSKQDEIRDGVITNIAKACPNLLNKDVVTLADKILKDEDSQGMVIKVDKPLPSDERLANLKELIEPTSPYYFKKYTGSFGVYTGETVGERQFKSYLAKDGYEAVESLIKEG